MKKIMFMLMLLCFVSFASASLVGNVSMIEGVSATVPTSYMYEGLVYDIHAIESGLVSAYPFYLTENARDVFGSNNGIISGVTFNNSGANFDGNSNINITGFHPVSGSNDLPFSFVLTFNPSSQTRGTLIARNDLSNAWQRQYQLEYTADGQISFRLFQGTSGSTFNFITIETDGTNLTPNQEYHIVTTYNGNKTNSGMKIYVNGVESSTIDINQGTYTGMNATNTLPTSIGSIIRSTADTRGVLFNGTIKDVQIYNRALSSSEVEQLYNESVNLEVVDTALVSAYPFNVYQNSTDAWGSNNGVATNVTFNNEGAVFGGTNSNSSINNLPLVATENSFTIVVNIIPYELNSNWIINSYQTSSLGMHLDRGGDRKFEPSIDSNNLPTNKSLNLNTNNHLVLTFNKSNNLGSVYIDGELITSVTITPVANRTIPLALTGFNNNGVMSGNSVNATIKNVQIYNRALSSSEVEQLYNQGQFTDNAINKTDSAQQFNVNDFLLARVLSANTYSVWQKDNGNFINLINNDGVCYVDGESATCPDEYIDITGNIVKLGQDDVVMHNAYFFDATLNSSEIEFYSQEFIPIEIILNITSGTLGNNDWYISNITFNISAETEQGEIDTISYCIDQVNSCTPTIEYVSDVNLGEEGVNYVRYNANTTLGVISGTQSTIIKIDKSSPNSTGEITSGDIGNDDWYRTDVGFTITPSDAYSGVNNTGYCVDSTNTCEPDTNYTGEIIISTEGNNYVRFASEDNAGNIQTTQSSGLIKIDKTPPTTFGNITSGTPSATGGYNTNVTYTIFPQDNLSGVNITYFCFDSTDTCNPTTEYTQGIVLNNDIGDYENYVRFFSIDNAGNNQTVQSSGLIWIDTISPAVTTNFINNSMFIHEEITGQWNFSDLYLYRWNISLNGEQIDGDINVNYTEYSYNLSVHSSTLPKGINSLQVQVADGHTAKYIDDYEVKRGGLFHNSDIRFTTKENEISIKAKDRLLTDSFNYERKQDRYEFIFNPSPARQKPKIDERLIGDVKDDPRAAYNSFTFIVETKQPSNIVYRPDSEYYMWIVSGNNWIDFLGEGINNNLVQMNRVSENIIEVTVYYEPELKELRFNSIGDLNIVTLNYQFYVISVQTNYIPTLITGTPQTVQIIVDATGAPQTYSFNQVNATFKYDDVPISLSKSANNNIFTFTSSEFLAKSVTSDENVTLETNVQIINQDLVTIYNNQSVIPLVISVIDGSDTCETDFVPTLNLFGFDEVNPNQELNFSGNIAFDLLSESGTNYLSLGFSLPGNLNISNHYTLCLFPENANLLTDIAIEYSAPDYSERKYIIKDYLLNNETSNLNLYLLNDTITSDIILNVYDRNRGTALDGAIVKIQRYYPQFANLTSAAYRTVQIEETDVNGQSLAKLVLGDVWYRFIVEYPSGTVVYVGNIERVLSVNKDIPIALTGKSLVTYRELVNMNGDVTYNANTQTFTFLWNNPANTDITGVLRVYQDTGFRRILVHEENITSSSATIAYQIPGNITNQKYVAEGWVII